jgi:chromate transporter
MESYPRLFWRFLKFGLLAWGGPVAQIGMLKQELVDEERWITPEKFKKVLAVYQVLPGPEAHELTVYFGMLRRGRLGGLVAGFGFMLPGLVLMLGFAWLYARFGQLAWIVAAGYGLQPAVLALMVRALHRIGSHALTTPFLWAGFVVALAGSMAGVHFALLLVASGALAMLFASRQQRWLGIGLLVAAISVAAWFGVANPRTQGVLTAPTEYPISDPATPGAVFSTGLKSGLLTFGGAYTVVTFLKADAVDQHHWLSEAAFLDGLAIGGMLPSPTVILGTFVGFLASGWGGALLLTLGIFLPAFGFTLLGHRQLETIMENRSLHGFLDGVTAGVLGLMAVVTLDLAQLAAGTVPQLLIAASVLVLLFLWKHKAAVPVLLLAAAAVGVAAQRVFG